MEIHLTEILQHYWEHPKLVQRLTHLLRRSGIDGLEVGTKFFAVVIAHKGTGIADLMYDAEF